MMTDLVRIPSGGALDLLILAGERHGKATLADHPDGVRIEAGGRFHGFVPLKPDPERAGVLKERERCRRCVKDEMDKATAAHDCPSAHKLGKALAAIDAPPEPERSEFKRGYAMGAIHVQKLAAQIAYDKRLAAIRTCEDPAAMACRQIEDAIRDISTEPAR
jgi:hypothetical protein